MLFRISHDTIPLLSFTINMSFYFVCDSTNLGSHSSGWPAHRVLLGHKGRVTCLLYPHDEYPRYDKEFLVSGGADFSVKLWDIFTGDLLYTFSTHGGELLRLICTPPDCSVRVLYSSFIG